MSKVISAAAAAALIKDGAAMGAATCVMSGWPDELALAMQKRCLNLGQPARMTLVHAGNAKDTGPRDGPRQILAAKTTKPLAAAA